jgi:hypothetical protein
MSRIDEIYEAYYKGQAAAENDDVLQMAVHQGFGHIMAAMLPGGDSDEEIAFEKGYHGEELDLCYECEHVQENCECESKSSSKESVSEYSGGSDYDDRPGYSGGSGSSYSDHGSDYTGGGGGGGGGSTSGSGGLPLGVVIGGIGGGLLGIIYSGGQIANIKNPNDVSLGLQCGIPILALVTGAIGLGLVGEILKKLASPKSSVGSASGRGFLIGLIIFVVVLIVGYQLVFKSSGGWSWQSLTSSFSSGGKPDTSRTPFDGRHWKIEPFTRNNNRTAKLLWAYRFSLPSSNKGCVGDEQAMWVEPNSVVFVKVTEGKSGTFRVGTPDEQRTVSDTSNWMAARFVAPGQKQHPADFQVSGRKLFVVCEPSENMVVELEARRLPR